MNEFEIIQHYFKSLPRPEKNRVVGRTLHLGIGDDCALVSLASRQQLVISTDTLVDGVHFPRSTSAFDIGYKALAVNLSDLAAMGADPAWFTLSVTLPEFQSDWVKEFCQGLAVLMESFPIELIGGDTTRGPLSITIQVLGVVEHGQAITRGAAQLDDDIYVSGKLGEAGIGLQLVQSGQPPVNAAQEQAILRLNRPLPRITLGQRLRGVASSCIDISDGLLGDMAHLLSGSGLGAEVQVERVPLAECLANPEPKDYQFAINAGDDYELCFTAPTEARVLVQNLAEELSLPLTRIGTVVAEAGVIARYFDQSILVANSFQHF